MNSSDSVMSRRSKRDTTSRLTFAFGTVIVKSDRVTGSKASDIVYIMRARTVPNRERATSSNVSNDSRKNRKLASAFAPSCSRSTT